MEASKPWTAMRPVRRHSAVGLTARKRDEMLELARRWHEARDRYIERLDSPADLALILRRPRSLRERQRREGWVDVDLTVHYHQTAFLSAVGELRRSWQATLTRVRRLVGRNPNLSEVDRRWIYTVLRTPEAVQACMTGGSSHLPASVADGIDERDLTARVGRLMLRYRDRPRRSTTRRWFVLDSRLYRPFARSDDRFFHGAWVSVTGLRQGHRVRIPLAGESLDAFRPRPGRTEGPDLVVHVRDRITLLSTRRIEVTPRLSGTEAGIDKGYRTLVTLSRGPADQARSYGAGVGEAVSRLTIGSEDRIRLRRALVAHERSLKASEAAKARRIRRNNLGRERVERRSRMEKRRLREMVNRALNSMFLDNPDLRRIHVEGLDFSGRPRGTAFNRRLRRWLKGFLQRQLANKAELNGVELNVVNAAYTSQTCPRCWFTSSMNRHDDRFKCRSCSYTGRADAVAATNVLARGSDPAITRFTPSGAVKRILDERWRAARTGRARGSNGEAPREDVLEDETAAGAANNCRVQSTGTGLEHLGPTGPAHDVVLRGVAVE